MLLSRILKIKDEAKFNVKALVQKEEYQENLKLHLESEKETLELRTSGNALVLQEMRDFQTELQNILKLLDAKEESQSVIGRCGDLCERFPTLYHDHSVSHQVAAHLLKSYLVLPQNFSDQSLLNFDTYLAVRNLLTIGCSSTQIDLSEAREKNMVFMQLAFDTYWTGPFR